MNNLIEYPVLKYYDVIKSNITELSQANIIVLADRHFTETYYLNAVTIDSLYQKGDRVLVESARSHLKQQEFPLTWLISKSVEVKGCDSLEAQLAIRNVHENGSEEELHDEIVKTFYERNQHITHILAKELETLSSDNRLFLVFGEDHLVEKEHENEKVETREIFLKSVRHVHDFLNNHKFVIFARNEIPLDIPSESKQFIDELMEKFGDSWYEKTPQLKIHFEPDLLQFQFKDAQIQLLEYQFHDNRSTWQKISDFMQGFCC